MRATQPILELGDEFYDPVAPATFPTAIPRFLNQRWAERVGLSDVAWERHFARFEPLPGNLPRSLALRYHGHQFRHYNPDLGDGRGFLFAQLRDDKGRLLDLATKGSGQTPWSRDGDGRLTLKGGVREVLATEMLEALGVNTSKSFALFETGEALTRGDEPSPTRSAVLTRLSHGHIRIGSFQRLAFLADTAGLVALTRYCLTYLFDESGDDPVRLFDLVCRKTAGLAASYIAAGFVHGVLNSDNINITGESFDYGPWRFAPEWDEGFTAAYFDHAGLYSFGRQPEAIQWDVAQLAGCLALIGEAPLLSATLAAWPALFEAALFDALLARLGITPRGEEDRALVSALLAALRTRKVGIDRLFFDWRGGRVPADTVYSSEEFDRLKAALAGRERPVTHVYWSDPAPCSMLIDEVEAIWAAIAQADDWSPFETKIAAIRRMGDASRRMPHNEQLGRTQLDRRAAAWEQRRRAGASMSEILISTEPATGAEIWSGPIGDAATEVAAARAAWPEWAAHSVTYRIETLRRFANVVRSREQDFADLIARETGKPYWEAKTEVGAVINKVDISVAALSERTPSHKLEAAMGNKVAVRHKPHGVLAVLGPYNFPAHLPNGHIVPALLAGNAVVFKPSEKTPAVGAMLVDCFHEAGVPTGVMRLLIGGPDEGKALAREDGIDGLLFTGSSGAGLSLHRQFAETPHKILALELGGNNPIVVWDAKDLQAAAAIIVQSAYLSAGQRCTAARRLIVEDGQHEALIGEVVKLIDRIIVDHPHADPQPFMGPVIDQMTADILQDRFLGLMMKGGKPIRRLEKPYEERPYLTPALIDMTDAKDRLDEELFGPVLQLIRVKSFDDAIDEANRTRFGLAASILTKDPALYDRFWANVRAGVINWNRPTNGAPSNAPFGGVGMSGNHRPSAYYAADYCAYPVTSVEAEVERAAITEGLRPAYVPDNDRVSDR